MASTIQLQRTVTYASQFVRNAPLAFLNMSNDPAFSNADWVKQFILSAPMAWRWNRTSVSDVVTFPTFVTVPGTSDYSVSLPTFGWLEKATLYDTQNGFAVFELSTKLDSAIDNNPNQPTRISVQNDDGAGHITFRIFPAPDSVYNCCLEFQNAASQFTLLSQTWSPIPDYFSYLFNQGFIAKT